jgi:hypothetical protein
MIQGPEGAIPNPTRRVTCSRPAMERIATVLNKKFFPGAELKPAPRLADSIEVKVVLGRELYPRPQATAPLRKECGSKGRAGRGCGPDNPAVPVSN